MISIFKNRSHAGQVLAQRLIEFANHKDTVVLALPRGGVPVAFEVARRLHLPMDVIVVRKLGFPGHEEYAMGAIASGGVRVLNDEAFAMANIPEAVIETVAAQEEKELRRRELAYREGRAQVSIFRKTVLLIDDGIATGSTMRAAVRAVRAQGPSRIVIAVPTAPTGVFDDFAGDADEVISLVTTDHFRSVGGWYESFPQVSDAEVRDLLARSEAGPLLRNPDAVLGPGYR